MKSFGTISRGVKTPIIKEGDDLVNIVCDSILNATKKRRSNDRLQIC